MANRGKKKPKKIIPDKEDKRLIIKNCWKIFPLNPTEVKRVAWIRSWK